MVKRAQEALHSQPSQAALSCEPLPSATWKWADLLRSVSKFDVLLCDTCGGRCKVLAVFTNPFVVGKFLEAVGESTHTPTPTPARGPAVDDNEQLVMAW